MIKLRYDGRFDFLPGDNRQWTVMSHFMDQMGCDRYHSSFCYESLVALGILPEARHA